MLQCSFARSPSSLLAKYRNLRERAGCQSESVWAKARLRAAPAATAERREETGEERGRHQGVGGGDTHHSSSLQMDIEFLSQYGERAGIFFFSISDKFWLILASCEKR